MGVGAVSDRAVFLDRDGVLNRAFIRDGRPYPPATLAELEILPGVPEGLARLRAAGFRLIVVTNQPDVARGAQTREGVEVLHAALQVRLSLDEFKVCYHDDLAACACRKPAPGLLLAAVRDHHLNLAASFMVGDRWRDIEAGQRAGCRTVFIDYGYAEKRPARADVQVTSLAEAADWILKQEEGKDPHDYSSPHFT
jgi:D-glycero-D-manno-heptose 1,7-bisphosphate phosphatase